MIKRKMRPRLVRSDDPAWPWAAGQRRVSRNVAAILVCPCVWLCLGGAALALVSGLPAQTLRITGSIPSAGRMELANANGGLTGESSGRSVRIRIANDEGGLRPVVLTLRTNSSYSLTAEWKGPAGTSARISRATVSPAGGTGGLRADALKAAFTEAELSPGVPAVCIRGSAISRGGNDASSDNAVLIEMLLDVPPGAANATVLFTLNLGS